MEQQEDALTPCAVPAGEYQTLYVCLSQAMYNRHSEEKNIRCAIWNAFSLKLFGKNMDELGILLRSKKKLPMVREDTSNYVPLEEWLRLYAFDKKRMGSKYGSRRTSGTSDSSKVGHAEATPEVPAFVKKIPSLAKSLVLYALSNVTMGNKRKGSDVCVVAPIVADLYGIGTIMHEVEPGAPSPGAGEPTYIYNPENMPVSRCIHLLKYPGGYEVITDEDHVNLPIPTRVVSSLHRPPAVVKGRMVSPYKLMGFDPQEQRCFDVAKFNPPTEQGFVVHTVFLDFRLGKDHWQYTIKGCQGQGDKVYIYAVSRETNGRCATFISSWNYGFVDPILLMRTNEEGILVVPAEDKLSAARIVIMEHNCTIRDIRMQQEGEGDFVAKRGRKIIA